LFRIAKNPHPALPLSTGRGRKNSTRPSESILPIRILIRDDDYAILAHPMQCRNILIALWALLPLSAASYGGQSQVVVGNARFTVITPNLIRLEYAPDAKFTDEPTLFAFDRSQRFDANVTENANSVSIDTSSIHLAYASDGNPFNATNLQISVRKVGETVQWTPGLADPLNLGGTLRTLDQLTGPKDLGKGLISRSGWAVVDDSKSPILTSDWVASRPNQSETDWYFFGYGLDYKAAMHSLSALSGPVPLSRKYLLGNWYSRYWPYTSDQFKQIVQEYTDHGFPLDNIVMDMDWHVTQVPGIKRGYAGMVWTGYTWNKDLIPDPPALIKWFHDQGLHLTLNDHPADGVQTFEDNYAAFMHAMNADPDKGQLPFDAGNKKYLDTFWDYTHESLEKMGVDFWWLDWQQSPFTPSIPDLGNLAWLNHYYFTRSESDDDQRGVSFSRWAGWGDQKYPIHFSGDASTGWGMLAFEIPFTTTSGNVGCFFWSHDIGGHRLGRNEESYTRWCQFGALSAALRSHSTRDASMDRRPWKYPKWAEDSMRVSFQLRAELMPYIYTSAAESCRDTIPLLRPMYIEHPEMEAAYHNAQEYYFGDNLLVAPIVMPGVGPSRVGWQTVWFPPGTGPWYSYFTGERYDGGTEAIVASDINQFPLFVRGGVPLPMQPLTERPTTAPLDHLVVQIYPGDQKPGESELYEDDGITRAYRQNESARTPMIFNGNTVSIGPAAGHYDGQVVNRSYTIEFHDVQQPTSATVDASPATATYNADSFIAKVEVPARPAAQAVVVQLQAASADPQLIHQRSLATLLSGIVGKTIQPKPVKEMLADALVATDDPALTAPILAAVGVAVVDKNDGAYLYHGKHAVTIYDPAGIVVVDQATASLESASEPVMFADGTVIDLKPLMNHVSPEDSIIVPGKSAILHVNMKVDGHDCDWTMEVPRPPARAGLDLARAAHVTASSTEPGYNANGVIDGVADGYPGDKSHEWASNNEKAGAWIRLDWDDDQSVSRVLLFDRISKQDHVLAGRVVFSDGSDVPFGELSSDPTKPVELSFPARTIRWMRVEITKVAPSTISAGLTEIGVFK
jgi:alpha-glucosidase (family GH31 glycosyl hydrolase)